MAASEKKTMYLYSTNDGLPAEVQTHPIAASQGIWMPGAPFYVSQAGTMKISDTADGTGDTYHGFLLKEIAAEQAANTSLRMSMIDIGDTYAVQLENNGTDIAEAQGYVGDQYGLTVSATAGQIGLTTIDINNANACVQIVDIMSNRDDIEYDTTATPGFALCRFLDSVVNVSRA